MPFQVSQETVFPVTEETEIKKGSEAIGLSNLNVGDPVTIQYYLDSSGAINIVRIDVNV
jgi:cell envelope opacity-associated protein A